SLASGLGYPARVGRGGWVGWVSHNRAVASGVALALVIALVDLGVVAARSGPAGGERDARAGATTIVGSGAALPAGTGSQSTVRTPGTPTPPGGATADAATAGGLDGSSRGTTGGTRRAAAA